MVQRLVNLFGRLNHDWIYWHIAMWAISVSFNHTNFFDNIHAFNNLSENTISHTITGFGFIQEIVVLDIYEKLGGGAVRNRGSSHCQSSLIVRQAVFGFVYNWFLGVFLFHFRGETATLNHEGGNYTVKNRPVIMPRFHIREKILDSYRGL